MNQIAKTFSVRIVTLLFLLSTIFQFFDLQLAYAAGPVFVSVNSNKSVNLYDKYELKIQLNASFDNPLRSKITSETYHDIYGISSGTGIQLDAHFTSPSGRIYNVPGFWDVPYQYNGGETFAIAGEPAWYVRFTPEESGDYQYYLTATDKNGSGRYPSTGTDTFTCNNIVSTLNPHGFVRVSTTNPGYLEYEDGTPYTQFGLTGPSGVSDVASTFQLMKDNGGNFQRHWLTNGDKDELYRRNNNLWSMTKGSFTVETNTSYVHAGKRSILVSLPGTTGDFLGQPVGVRANSWYKASVYVKTNSDFSGQENLKIQDNNNVRWNGNTVIASSNSGWIQTSVIFQARSNSTSITFQLAPTNSTSPTGTMWVDDASLYETDSAGNPLYNYNQLWNPSFEDAAQWKYKDSTGTVQSSNRLDYNPSQLNQLNLWKFDYVLQQAEKNGIILQPTIFDYKEWSGKCGDHSTWAYFFNLYWNPTDNGGCYSNNTADSFFAPTATGGQDSAVVAQEKEVFRNLIARYSYSPSLGVWEIGNEGDPSGTTARAQWLDQMVQYFHTNDPFGHPVTNSYWYSPGGAALEKVVDVSSVHYYINDDTRNPTTRVCEPDEYIWAVKRKQWVEAVYPSGHPWISGEFGLMGDRTKADGSKSGADISKWDDPDNPTWLDAVSNHDTTGVFFHNSVWSMLMANSFKSSVSNWWFRPFQTWNYQNLFKGPSAFAQSLPFHDSINSKRISTYSTYSEPNPATPGSPLVTDVLEGGDLATSSNANIRVLGRRMGDNAYLWAQNKYDTWGNIVMGTSPTNTCPAQTTKTAITDQTGTINIPNFSKSANFVAKYFDTITGAILQTLPVKSDANGNLTLSVNLGSNFTTTNKPDIAIQITPVLADPITITQTVTTPGGGTIANPGDKITFNITAKNNSAATQTVNLKDDLATSNVDNFYAVPSGTVTQNSSTATISWPSFDLIPGGQKTLVVYATAKTTFATSDPIISAGSDQKAYPMKKIAQSATVTNPGSGIATWTWSKTSGPGTVTFDSPSSQSTNISADIAGTYAIGVTAQDSSGKSAQSSMNLTIYKMSDINNDTKIDTNDFTLLLYNWGTPKNLMTDLDGNGIVDNNDFTIMLYWWGK